MGDVAAIVLAAGRASRYGAAADDSKVYAALQGRALVAWAAAGAIAAGARPVVVVTGRGGDRAPSALAGLDVEIAHNSRYADGMAGSIGVGLARLPAAVDGALVMLADMPLVRAATVAALIAAFRRERADAIVPTLDGRRGNPVLFSRELFAELAALSGDEGARRLLSSTRVRLSTCSVDDLGIVFDIDTPGALAQAASLLAGGSAAADSGGSADVQAASDRRSSISRSGIGGAK